MYSEILKRGTARIYTDRDVGIKPRKERLLQCETCLSNDTHDQEQILLYVCKRIDPYRVLLRLRS